MSKTRRNDIMIPDDPPKGPPLLLSLLLMLFVPVGTVIGGYLLFKRGKNEYTRRQLNDYRHYAAIIGDRSSVSVRELANRLGKTTDQVTYDLQNMINQGMMDPRAYIDRNSLILHLAEDVVETSFVNDTVSLYAKPQPQKQAEAPQTRKAPPRPQPEAKPQPKPRPQARPAGMDSEDFEAKLREIRKLNEEIENPVVSERIDRIGTLTASIFRVVREKPERAEEVRKFMNYYLPTTLKLLKSYSLMEKQSYQGENIAASRKKIEDVLGTLVHAFEQQQDMLFQSEALDVETDISVLETMMASDGLTEKSRGLHL